MIPGGQEDLSACNKHWLCISTRCPIGPDGPGKLANMDNRGVGQWAWPATACAYLPCLPYLPHYLFTISTLSFTHMHS